MRRLLFKDAARGDIEIAKHLRLTNEVAGAGPAIELRLLREGVDASLGTDIEHAEA